MLTSTGGSSMRSCLNTSRRYRFTRLRTTAQPIFLLAVIPIRADGPLLSRHTIRNPLTEVLDCALERDKNSDRFLKRTVFGNSAPPVSKITAGRLLGRNSYGQIFASFSPSALDYQPTILGGHSNQKTMCAFTTDITWLESSFHLCLPLLNYFSGNGLLITSACRCQGFYYTVAMFVKK